MKTLPLLRPALLAALLSLAACDDAGIRGLNSGDRNETARASYSREMIFVADDATAAAVLEFTTVDAGSSLKRTARGWAEAGSGWTPLYNLSWEGAPVRRAWRLVPHGPIRLRVGMEDEIESVIVRDGETAVATLETGDFLSEWTPFRTAQLVLREASLALDGEAISGWLVDARFGTAPQATDASPAIADAPHAPAPAAGSAAEPPQVGPPGGTGDSMTSAPPGEIRTSAAAVRSVRAVLFGPEGATLVVGETETGLAGWLRTLEREDVFPVVDLAAQADGRAWTIEAEGGRTLSGRLQVLDEDPAPLSPRMVGGTLRAGAAELEMRGVLKTGE